MCTWEDAQGKIWVSYNSPVYLLQRHGLPAELMQNIAVIETLASNGGDEAINLSETPGIPHARRHSVSRRD
jgi:hypothetical protein